ncbi:hypothetical protein Sps_02430 [Shewanella psychrophila]|uniref:Uncharacterized protein n=1 Tax=Shewanella psychrophila TaxID=225848 RepID=A0A1S6HQ20_9GAMM|nr:hypothetical protein Sps_02430 [Shewanella psychrophila]
MVNHHNPELKNLYLNSQWGTVSYIHCLAVTYKATIEEVNNRV